MKAGLIAIPVVLLAGLVLLSGRLGWAAVQAHEVRYLMNTRSDALSQDPSVWQQAERWARAMRRGDPGNPEYLDLHGRLLQLRAGAAPTLSERDAHGQTALEIYLESSARRPTWPHTRARQAETLALVGEFDELFDESLRAAAKLGPWEPNVQLAIARTGLMHWTQLGTDQHAIVLNAIRRGLRQQPRVIQESVRLTGRLSVVCRALVEEPGMRDYCRDNL